MSLSVRVRASSASGSRASRRKYGDFIRAASTRLATWRSVMASAASGSSQGSHSSCARVKARGAAWSGGTRIVSGMKGPLVSARGKSAQSGNHADLEGQERDDLGQRHDFGCGPAGVQQRLEGVRGGIARVEDEHVRVLEGRGEAETQRGAGLRVDAIRWPDEVLAT